MLRYSCNTFFLLRELTPEHGRLAKIIEMIHTASLMHNDVLDESDMKRVWRNFIEGGRLNLPFGSDYKIF
ncbi:putative all-trans-nonaprenyl-diphosphate synthase (geranylgeranyl-diphosphate specific) [Helianthus annuus]|nr:putative all-trans-nonaprenyl-diphosphate synthase (geranylgeranyl-diphosphate specific) [Helianthus annuus]